MAGGHAGGRHQYRRFKCDGDRDHGFNGHRVDGDGFVRHDWLNRFVRLVQLNRLISLRHL